MTLVFTEFHYKLNDRVQVVWCQ